MKTILLIRNVAPDKFGGGELYQLRLAAELKKYDYNPVIVTSSDKLLEESSLANIESVRAPFIKNQNWSGLKNFLLPIYFIKQRGLRKFYKQIYKKYKPAVVNIQSRDEQLAATKVAIRKHIAVIWTDHADFRNWVLWNIDKKFKNTIGKKIVKISKKIDAIIAISDTEKENIRGYFPEGTRIEVVKNGCTDLLKQYMGKRVASQSFCFVGRVVKEKGINELLEAMREIKNDYKKATLKIYGEGDKDLIRKLKRNDGVEYGGYINDTLAELAKSEIFVLPSYQEGMSLSLIEAAMMQKPIITTNVGGNKEIVTNKKSGLLIESQDSAELIEAMRYMLENQKDAEQMAKAARKKFEKEFDFSNNVKKSLIPLLKEITSKDLRKP